MLPAIPAAILLAWDNKVTEKINLTVSAFAIVFHVTAVEKMTLVMA